MSRAYVLTGCRSTMFLFFSFGMAFSSLQFALKNLTTIENLNKGTAIWTFAVRLPDEPTRSLAQPPPSSDHSPPPPIAILKTKPGDNPWDLGPLENLKSVMGERILDWVLPIKASPCSIHDRADCAYRLGPVLRRLGQESGLKIES